MRHVDLGELELGDRALGPGVAGPAVLAGPDVGEAQDLGVDPQLHEPVAPGRVVHRHLARQMRTASAMAPVPRPGRPPPPPMVVRSFIRVVMATRQPSPTSPMRSASGTRTSVR
jgi:hypothetical protein